MRLLEDWLARRKEFDLKVTTRKNQKNMDLVQTINSLREGGEPASPCPDGEHQLVTLITGSAEATKVRLRQCLVCKTFEWEDME